MSSLFDEAVVREAETTVDEIVKALLSLRGRGAVVGEAPAGAGKSYAIGTGVMACRKKGLRVAVATPTNDQAYSTVEHLAGRVGEDVLFVPASSVSLPPEVARKKHVRTAARARDASGADLIVGTLNKLGDAFARGDLAPFDVLLVDEAFQANAVQYYAVGALANRHLLMGDRGQLAPFTAAPEGHRWRGLDEDPLLTAAEVLRRNHQDTPVFKLPVTRRLDPRGAKVARAFYPGHSFSAAVRLGARRLELAAPRKKSTELDRALELAAGEGWAHLELPGAALAIADPGTLEVIVDLVRRLVERKPVVSCESKRTPVPLEASSIAVAVSHNDQKNFLRAALDDAGLPEVVVNTANKLQGLTYEVLIAWHPLAGQAELDEFHLDPGRLCVMLTRHRHACIVVGRASDRELVKEIPPSSPAFVGWDQNPTLDGWYAHEEVFEALSGYRLALR